MFFLKIYTNISILFDLQSVSLSVPQQCKHSWRHKKAFKHLTVINLVSHALLWWCTKLNPLEYKARHVHRDIVNKHTDHVHSALGCCWTCWYLSPSSSLEFVQSIPVSMCAGGSSWYGWTAASMRERKTFLEADESIARALPSEEAAWP